MKKIPSLSLVQRTAGLIVFQFLIAACTIHSFSQSRSPVYPPDISGIEKVKEKLAPLMKMPVGELIAQVPAAGGVFFIGCPNCKGGAEEAGVLRWEPGMGDQVRCNFCNMVFPNEKFPHNREKVIIAPSGTRQVYRYHQNSEGLEYFYEAHAWYEQWKWIQQMAVQFARVWYATKDNEYGDRAAAIAGQFAKVFPDYPVRYDYPSRPKKFFPANQKWPYQDLSDHRGSKWDWWAYMDISAPITTVYDILNSGYDWTRMDEIIGPKTKERIRVDLLKLGYEFTTAHPEDYSNMAPGKYRDMIRLGRVINDPEMVHEAVKRFRELLSRGFFADGWWMEGATSYHNQTVGGLRSVNEVLKGYTDPPERKGERFENLDLEVDFPLYQRAVKVSREAVLPDGRSLPVNDTWAIERAAGFVNTNRTVSRLWPSLGNAALGSGEGADQVMLNLNWSGNYGHSHTDNGSIILFAAGQELLPDIGYTHTRYKSWALTTASHNTVVINQQEQDKGSPARPATGNLKFYDNTHLRVKAIDLDASPAYTIAKTYRRRLVLVNAGPGKDYVVDRFDVEGGRDHDWFLHGMCEQEGTLETSISLNTPLESLVPDWGGKDLPKNQYETDPQKHHPYLFLRDLKRGEVQDKAWAATWKYDAGAGLRVHNFAPIGTQAFRFKSPSIRRAREDDNKIDDFMSNGIMQRHSGGSSSFISVHEPFRNEPWIESVEQEGDVLLIRYKTDGALVEDRITMNGEEISVRSSAGWAYHSGKPVSGRVKSLEGSGGKYILQLDKNITPASFIRLDLSNGGTRYYQVASVNGNMAELASDPGFTIGLDGKIIFHTFPKDQHEGPLNYTVFVR